jgi:hypothetical protein
VDEKKLDIPDWMVIGAFRYCLGRMTNVVKECADWICQNWDDLNDSVKAIIEREMEEEFRRDDRARERGGSIGFGNILQKYITPLGMDCDRAEWERVRALYRHGRGEEVES